MKFFVTLQFQFTTNAIRINISVTMAARYLTETNKKRPKTVAKWLAEEMDIKIKTRAELE